MDKPDEPARQPGETSARTFEERAADRFAAAGAEFHAQFNATREQFDAANAKIRQRTGRDLIPAILIGIGIGAVFLVSLLIFKDIFLGLAIVGIGGAAVEFTQALIKWGRNLSRIVMGLGAAAVILAAYFWPGTGQLVSFVGVLVFVWIWLTVATLVRRRPAKDWASDIASGTLVVLYVILLGSFAVSIVFTPGGEWWLLALVIAVVSVDTGAYAAGLNFGRHPLAPRISPKKTWEGLAGAAVLAIVSGILLSWLMIGMPWYFGFVFGVVVLVTATAGDLFESQIKRNLGVKDISDWLPGHGGILDRLDSILPTLPAVFILMSVFR